ncbi:polyprenyl synthetase family protein [Atopobacter sp. AH10]|uniref:polyprenyl synthetase family protein n=1 Tax=Atopobacter sp. AH10 TaxID=2315861 RepID=UPI0013141077|nr:polyprenyl synthetase family protein [Atopobacter sp. AH10]
MNDLVQKTVELIEMALSRSYEDRTSLLMDGCHYAICSGGKRLRPLLVFATNDWLGGEMKQALPIALTVELIHNYSLVHDDLPEMDNDELRRGKATVQKQYGHSLALLIGDALLSDCWLPILNSSEIPSSAKVAMMQTISDAIGSNGMIYGQFLDSISDIDKSDIIQLEKMHQLKTGRLIQAAACAPFDMYQTNYFVEQRVRRFVKIFGLAFQVHNDLKDVLMNEEEAGKNVLHDQKLKKATYPSLLGISGALDLLESKIDEMQLILEELTDHCPNSLLGRAIYEQALKWIDVQEMREKYEERTC